MAISLKRLIELGQEPAVVRQQQAPASTATQSTATQSTPQNSEFNVGVDFTNFERTIAAFTENAKNQFQTKLLNLVGNKKVFLRGSKGYGQPIKDYTINVKNVSIDFYYERYVVVFKDENDKEYFLEPGYKIKILGNAQMSIKKPKKKKQVPLPPAQQPQQVPQPPKLPQK